MTASTALFTRLLVLTPICMVLVGCGNGSPPAAVDPTPGPEPGLAPPTVPPVVERVTPGGQAGESGSHVTFAAVAGPCPCTFAWSFDSGVEPLPSEEAAPRVRLREPGTHLGRVTARNAKGESAGFPFAFEVKVAPGTPVPSGVIVSAVGGGEPTEGASGTFAAILPAGVQVHRWELGAGATPRSSEDSEPTVAFRWAGTYRGTVTVAGANGALSAPFEFTYSVGPPGDPPQLLRVSLEGRPGVSGATVTAEAVRRQNAAEVIWSLGGGATPSIFSGDAPVTLGLPGVYRGSLSLQNSLGSVTHHFQYVVERSGPEPPTWIVDRVFEGSRYGVGPLGRGIARFSVSGIALLTSPIPYPEGGLTWTRREIAPEGTPLDWSEIDGRPVVVYSAPAGITVAQALAPMPESSGDWRQYAIAAASDNGARLWRSSSRELSLLVDRDPAYFATAAEFYRSDRLQPLAPDQWRSLEVKGWELPHVYGG
ncbi:MAG TPA: hypothetical protein VEI97_18415, partial [bacterium]|nr:hypothetical protein [bacterium]